MRDRLDLLGLRATQQTLEGLKRMAPGETGAAQVLLSAVSPVRNYAHNHEFLQIRHKETATEQPLGTLADSAMPDTPLADLFNAEAAAFVGGETALKPDLIRMLTLWAENDEAFQRAAAHHPALATGLGASAELAALARAGLAALGQGRGPGWREQARAALDTAQADIAASASIRVVTHARQPAGDLIQRITPGVALLIGQDRP
jgi:hexosaminidase